MGEPAAGFEVDAVYTWANAADPEWQAARRAARETYAAHGYPPTSDASFRYRDHGELRYSLRSLEQNAPFFRRIHIVHGGAPPAWLRTDVPGVSTIRDEALFPDPALLPSYSSDAIEAFIHRIPGLAEHYVYFNDDFFLSAPTRVGDFFDADGTAVIQVPGVPLPPPREGEIPYFRSVRNAVRMLEPHLGAYYRPIFKMRTPRRLWSRASNPSRGPLSPEVAWNLIEHVAQPFRKSVWPRFHALFPEEMRTLTRYRFRHPEVFPTNMVAAYLSLHEGLARFVYPSRSLALFPYLGREVLEAQRRRLLGPVEQRPRFLCLNDGLTDRLVAEGLDWGAFVTETLEALFPTPSRWERDQARFSSTDTWLGANEMGRS